MFPRDVAFFALSYATVCLALKPQDTTTTKASAVRTILSEAEILLSAAACVTAIVLVVFFPTFFYEKYCNKRNRMPYKEDALPGSEIAATRT